MFPPGFAGNATWSLSDRKLTGKELSPQYYPAFSKSTENMACSTSLKYCTWKLPSKLFKCSIVKLCISGFLLLKQLQDIMYYNSAILLEIILQIQHKRLSHENLLNRIKENKHPLQRDLLTFLRHFIAYWHKNITSVFQIHLQQCLRVLDVLQIQIILATWLFINAYLQIFYVSMQPWHTACVNYRIFIIERRGRGGSSTLHTCH